MDNNKKRYALLIASMAMQSVLGVIYIWGVFQPHVVKTYGWSTGTASLTFSIVLAFFVLGGILGGYFSNKLTPRIVVLVSGIMIGAGVYLASFTKAENPYYLYATYGMLAGTGIGAIYTTTIGCAQKWFPEKKGLATGLVLSSLGFGGVIFTPLANTWLKSVGIAQTFVNFSLIFATVCILGSIFMFKPEKGASSTDAAKNQYNTRQMLKTKMFLVLVVTMTLSLPTFFMLSPLIKVIGVQRGMEDSLATTAVMMASILNSTGRLIAPVIAGKVGNKQTVLFLNVVTIGAAIALIFSNAIITLVLISVVALCFGGLLGVYPIFTTRYFGVTNAGANYGFVLIGYGIAAIFGPKIYDIFTRFGAGVPFMVVAALSALSCVVLILSVKKPEETTQRADINLSVAK